MSQVVEYIDFFNIKEFQKAEDSIIRNLFNLSGAEIIGIIQRANASIDVLNRIDKDKLSDYDLFNHSLLIQKIQDFKSRLEAHYNTYPILKSLGINSNEDKENEKIAYVILIAGFAIPLIVFFTIIMSLLVANGKC